MSIGENAYDMKLNSLDRVNNRFRPISDKSTNNLTFAMTRTAPPMALVEDDSDVRPERPTSGPEIDDLPGRSEADDMFPPSTNKPKKNDGFPPSTNKPKKNDGFPGVDNAVVPGRDSPSPGPDKPLFPEVPEVERTLPDVNIYQKKKIFAQGMMDLALFTANANQLRYVLDAGPANDYYYVSLTCILISILLQIVVGVLLIWNSSYNIHKEHHIIVANRINNFTIIGIFLITILNVLISAFGLPDRSDSLPPSAMSNQDVETVTPK